MAIINGPGLYEIDIQLAIMWFLLIQSHYKYEESNVWTKLGYLGLCQTHQIDLITDIKSLIKPDFCEIIISSDWFLGLFGKSRSAS